MSADRSNARGRRRGRRPHGQTILRGRYDGEFDMEGVWLHRRSVIAQVAELGFDLVLSPNISVWRNDSRNRCYLE